AGSETCGVELGAQALELGVAVPNLLAQRLFERLALDARLRELLVDQRALGFEVADAAAQGFELGLLRLRLRDGGRGLSGFPYIEERRRRRASLRRRRGLDDRGAGIAKVWVQRLIDLRLRP